MRVAFVHCRIAPGGAISVLKDRISAEQFSDAKIFCLVSDQRILSIDGNDIQIITALPTWLNNFFVRNTKKNIPLLKKIFDYRNLIVFYPQLMKILSRKLRRFAYDKVSISSFAVAKNIDFDTSKPHTLYLHSPMQYIRTHKDEYEQKIS